MKYSKRLGFLNGFLNVVGFLIALTSIMLLIGAFGVKNKTSYAILALIVVLVISAGYLITILKLKEILKSVKQKDPFNIKSIENFKDIGYYILLIGIVEAIINYPKPYANLGILATSYGSLKPVFFVYLVFSILCFVLSDVFRMAMEIKDENDLTV